MKVDVMLWNLARCPEPWFEPLNQRSSTEYLSAEFIE